MNSDQRESAAQPSRSGANPSRPRERSDRPQARARGSDRRFLRYGTAVGLIGLLILVVSPYVSAWYTTAADRAALRLLHSRDPELRMRGAAIAAREQTPRAWQFMADALAGPTIAESSDDRSESDAAVRAAYVGALGQSRWPRLFPSVARLVEVDPDPRVRQAAWEAAVRLDPGKFRDLAARVPRSDDAWDQIGRASARLELGDVGGVGDLFRWAVEGDEAQRRAASLELYRAVAPLLEAVGRWPLGATIREGAPCPAELVAEVQRRCEALNLQALAADCLPHAVRAAPVRRNIGRLLGVRERLARFLFGP